MPLAGSIPVVRTINIEINCRTANQNENSAGEGANKGVFVTTSDFSREARDYLNKVQHRIVLINGERLARLMIQHEVGVRARRSFVIRSVDETRSVRDFTHRGLQARMGFGWNGFEAARML